MNKNDVYINNILPILGGYSTVGESAAPFVFTAIKTPENKPRGVIYKYIDASESLIREIHAFWLKFQFCRFLHFELKLSPK